MMARSHQPEFQRSGSSRGCKISAKDYALRLVSASLNNQIKKVNQIMDVSRYRDITRLLRVTALVLKFLYGIKNRKLAITANNIDVSNCGQLNSADHDEAETTWIKVVQASPIPKEIEFLLRDRTKTEHFMPLNYVTQFGIFPDESGVIRCKGMINHASLPVTA